MLDAVGQEERSSPWRSSNSVGINFTELTMNHRVMGYKLGEDVAVYKQGLSISLSELKNIMGWEADEDCIYVYDLSVSQLLDIEKTSGLVFPEGLFFQLDCYV